FSLASGANWAQAARGAAKPKNRAQNHQKVARAKQLPQVDRGQPGVGRISKSETGETSAFWEAQWRKRPFASLPHSLKSRGALRAARKAGAAASIGVRRALSGGKFILARSAHKSIGGTPSLARPVRWPAT